MNETLSQLCSSYLDAGTGSVVLYYSFDSGSVSSLGDGSNFTGVFKNESPSFAVNYLSGLVLEATGSSANVAETLLKTKIVEDSFDVSFSNVRYGGFSGQSFLRPDDFDSEFVYLFSFRRTQNEDGVLFGSLVKDQFDNGSVNFSFGRGFNIGVNDRNQLFFQGSDSSVGDYVLTANELELSNENICSARISPYEVSFVKYNLFDDEFQQQSLRTDCKVENNSFTEPFYIGGSPTYLRSGRTFSGFIDNLLIISGNYSPSDLKAISSGFVASGIRSSGSSYSDDIVTGHSIELLYQSGVTGYQPVITGYRSAISGSDLISFTLVSATGASVIDGERFVTGYTLPNNSGYFVEETSFLLPYSQYKPTGDDVFATLGLKNSGGVVTTFVVTGYSTGNSVTGIVPLYGFNPITGILLNSPTGYLKTTLSTTILRTGNLVENLQFFDSYKGKFKKDYLYYLDKRL